MFQSENYDTIIFDLDDTIFDEKIYIYKSYEAISNYLEGEYQFNSNEAYQFLTRTFENEGRSELFNKLCTKLCLHSSEINILLSIMRNVTISPKIEPNQFFIPLIKKLVELNKNIAVITNGNIIQQRNKIDSINWYGLMSKITFILANEYAPKPNPASFNILKKVMNIKSVLFIGDSKSDEDFANNCGINFLHVDNFR